MRHLKIDKGQFVVKNVLVLHVHQLHLMVHAVIGILVVGEDNVEDAYGIDALELKVPVTALCLLSDGEGGIEHAFFLSVSVFISSFFLSVAFFYDFHSPNRIYAPFCWCSH